MSVTEEFWLPSYSSPSNKQAAPAAPVELEPVGYFYIDERGFWEQVGDPIGFPSMTPLYALPPDAAAVIAKLERKVDYWRDLAKERINAYKRYVELQEQLAKLTQELETERMRLAACGVVAMANTPELIYKAMLEAAPAAPVELEPVAWVSGYLRYALEKTERFIPISIEVSLVNMGWKNQIPLVRQSDAAAVIAAKDAEISELQQDLQTTADALGHAHLELAAMKGGRSMKTIEELTLDLEGECLGEHRTDETVIDFAKRLIAAWQEQQEPAVQEWLPIETAPKDGTRIFAMNFQYGARETYWRLYGEGSIAKVSFDAGLGPNGYWNWQEPQNHWGGSWTPTHWMSLPKPPIQGEEK